MIDKVFLKSVLIFCSAAMLFGGCRTAENASVPPEMKFKRFFCWGYPNNETNAARYAAAGVTDIQVANQKQCDLALKYGMNPYWKCFHPVGPHKQVMTEEEQKHHIYIKGLDLDKKLSRSERKKIIDRRRIEKNFRYGGETLTEIDTLYTDIDCFNSDENLDLTRKKIDSLLKEAPEGVAGMYLDFIGYTNFKGCYCKDCIAKYRKYLAERNLKDTVENQTAFYREKLVEYYNKVIDYIKSRRPDYKIAVHIYPVFKNDPLYGNRTKADYCGQTVSWYFKWDEAKIKKYTDFVLDHARDHYFFAEGIPFVGVSADKIGSLGYKTPEEVEHDLRTVLLSGGKTLMVCDGRVILKDGYFEVFRKYCGKE